MVFVLSTLSPNLRIGVFLVFLRSASKRAQKTAPMTPRARQVNGKRMFSKLSENAWAPPKSSSVKEKMGKAH